MPFQESRVYVRDYAIIPVGSSLLTPVPTAPGHKQQYIHKAVFPDFMAMSDAVHSDLGFPILVASGHRPPLWDTIEDYNVDMIKQYGSVAEGRKWRAFQSSHFCGLAFDFGCGGLTPDRSTIPQQKKTKLYAWVVAHAWEYGWHPYKPENWHLEHRVSQDAFKTGIPDKPGHVLESVIATQPLIIQNDVCEDNTCMASPLDPSLTSHS